MMTVTLMLVMMLVDEAGLEMRIGHESHLAGAVIGVMLALLWPRNKTVSIKQKIEGEENDR